VNQYLKVAVLIVIAFAVGCITLKFVLPLFANLFVGFGVEIPPPLSRIAMRFPRLTLILLFGGPPIVLLVLALVAWRLLRHAT
jgi:type II secretory pathway component PulF